MVNVELPDSWEKVNLGNALSYIGNGLTDKQNKVKDGYPVTRIETISDDCINADKVGYISTLPEDKIEKYRLYYGDMLVSHINSDPQLGRSVIYEGNPEFLLHGMNLLRMRANTKMLAPFFLNLIFRFYRNCGVFIALASRAVGQSSINQSRMKSLIIPLPPLPEQRAIAHVLQTIQEAKAARQRELALERERKAALMDHLFSYGTKGEPRKETEIGEIPESWEVVRLEKLCACLDSKRVPVKQSERNERIGNIPYYGASGQTGWIDDYLFDVPLLLVAEDGENLVSRKLPIAYSIEGKSWVNNHAHVLKITDINQFFLEYYFNSIDLSPYLSGTTRPKLNKASLLGIPISRPSRVETDEIALVLSSCDTKIAALEQEAEHLDELFHAMLDELMTGKRSAVPLIDAELPN